MNHKIEAIIQQSTGAKTIKFESSLQSLWSGYGSVDRYSLNGCETSSVIVKHVRLPDEKNHPRGWNTELSHQRKLKSYRVESHWYEQFSEICDDQCRLPKSFATEQADDEFIMVMEDLDANGFALRKTSIDIDELKQCLKWLAAFHARFMQCEPEGLWSKGSYWHLETRPDELIAMPDGPLKDNAGKIDQLLDSSEFKTIIHGDAKLANFCFSSNGEVAAVDFQYVGGGVGVKDIAYLISSCFVEDECAFYETQLLDIYFDYLRQYLISYQPNIDPVSVEQSWRPLYPVAWTDFLRFLQGWSPGHWKIHRYSQKLADQVLSSL